MRNLNRFILFSMILTGLSLISCKKKSLTEPETSPTPNNSTTDTTTNYYLSAEIDGNSWSTGDTTTRFYGQTQTIGWLFNPAQGGIQIDYSAFFIHKDAVNIDDNTYGEIRVNFSGYTYTSYTATTNAFEITCNDFQSSLSVPITSFYTGTAPDQSGLEIIYMDSNAEKWSSKLGDQTGSNILITYNHSTNPIAGYQTCARKYRGTFHCKVYKESDPSQYKVISNGLFHAYIGNYEE